MSIALHSPTGKTASPRVLIVDDEATIALAIEEVLEDYDLHAVQSLAGARRAIEEEEPFELVLLDKNLPDGSGIDLIEEIVAKHPTLQVIVLTGYPTIESAIDAIEKGAFDYVPKPFDIVELELKVTRGIERHRLLEEEQRLLATLRESEERHRLLFESSPDPVFLLEGEGLRIDKANAAAQACYGYTEDEFREREIHDLEHPNPPTLDFDPMEWIPGLKWHQRCDGSAFPVESRSELCTVNGQRFIVHVSRDLSERLAVESERRSLDKQLTQAQKLEALGLLAGGITHDFNNVLTVMQGHAAFLSEFLESNPQLEDIDEAAYDLEQINQAIRSATHVTRQMLVFSRKNRPKDEVVDLNSVLTSLESMLRRFLEASVELVFDLDQERPQVALDRGQLEQAVLNLVLNARDAMQGSGTIRLETRILDDGCTRLAVRDTGCGMSDEVRKKIFDPFFTTKEASKGTGLGLPTVLRVVEEAGGVLQVESTLGEGTTFLMTLPPCDEELSGEEREKVRHEGRGETIALVEDHPQVSMAIARILERANYEVLTVPNAAKAIELCQGENDVDLWLLDMVLPDLRGDLLAQRLVDSDPDIRCIWITGYPEESAREQIGLDEDAIVMSKPLDDLLLLESMRSLLDLE